MSLISRYIFRETFAAWLTVMVVLFVILMSNQFAEILDDAAVGRLPRDAVFAILSLTSLRYLMVLTPIGLFLGVMLALARLNRDSEMAALAACGYSGFVEDIADVTAHGPGANTQLLGNPPIGLTDYDEAEHLHLSVGQAIGV